MASDLALADCLFCRALSTPTELADWHDRPLAKIPAVGGVIAGLGAFVPGYVLIFPYLHVTSTRLIPIGAVSRFQKFVSDVAHAIRKTYGPVTVFEHGSCPRGDARRSACLSHAHVHIIPGHYQLASQIQSTQREHHPAPAHAGCDSSYLFLKEPGQPPLHYLDPGISQYLRRRIAERLTTPDQWDWLLFPHLQNVSATVDELHGRLP